MVGNNYQMVRYDGANVGALAIEYLRVTQQIDQLRGNPIPDPLGQRAANLRLQLTSALSNGHVGNSQLTGYLTDLNRRLESVKDSDTITRTDVKSGYDPLIAKLLASYSHLRDRASRITDDRIPFDLMVAIYGLQLTVHEALQDGHQGNKGLEWLLDRLDEIGRNKDGRFTI